MARKKKFKFTSGEHLIRELKKYIAECGFVTDAKSFGTHTTGSGDYRYTESSPNEYDYYVMVTIRQFMNFVEREEKYFYDYLEHHQKKNRVELKSRVQALMYNHNAIGADLGHIPQYRFKAWETSVFNSEEILDKRGITKAQRRIVEARAKQEEKMAELESEKLVIVNRTIGNDPSE